MLTRVIFNQKGGVGKSSITVNLAAISAQQGLRTLLIDLDPQANASQYVLGQHNGMTAAILADFNPSIYDFFDETANQNTPKNLLGSAIGSLLQTRSKGLQAVMHQSRFANLTVIPAHPQLNTLSHILESKHKIYKLKEALGKLTAHFDRVFIDTPPAFNFFTLSALIAADRVLIPFDCDIFSHRALLTLLENILETRQDHNETLAVEGIIVNQFQSQARLPTEIVNQLKQDQLPVLDTMLPASVFMKESHSKNLPLIHLATEHKLTQAYRQLFQEIEAK
ncbi:ParA family protein [Acinetobacter qingfengensis]|uniref:Cobalamin biosynthesis protein CobQ n=1 Tax=Acinetobacter qingfengensis TaxID=1262585 RepID=A0A1E7QWD5_9GAMM|nr:ParA family protein [Acinetobacter qingfengensis]KAA8731324.1 ParA family protein [Acinetobacter qingfengensis]OEY91430.1 cobalamin biosynthesis protein CobQ [Acinetobacter qingfengensis]